MGIPSAVHQEIVITDSDHIADSQGVEVLYKNGECSHEIDSDQYKMVNVDGDDSLDEDKNHSQQSHLDQYIVFDDQHQYDSTEQRYTQTRRGDIETQFLTDIDSMLHVS